MAFGIGTKTQHTENTWPKGKLQEVAVKCWFTSKGESRPLMMKFMTEQEEIITVNGIHVQTVEKQWYAGIQTWKYKCNAIVNERLQHFTLLFTPDDCLWKIVL